MGLAGSLDSTEINSVEISEECRFFLCFRYRRIRAAVLRLFELNRMEWNGIGTIVLLLSRDSGGSW